MRARAAAALLGVGVLLSGCGFHGLYSTPLPGGADLGRHSYAVTVEFADVLDLVPQSAVKVNDVAVGRVESISLDGWHALVKLRVNGEVDLPANAHAELLQTSLLGEKYVQLEQPPSDPAGTLRDVHPPPGQAMIPIERTGRNPEVEEVLGAISLLLSGGGLPQIRTITHELDNALAGRSEDVRALIGRLNTFVGGLDRQQDKITRAIQNLDVLAADLDRHKQVLIDTLDTLPAALKVLDGERRKLVGLLDSLDRLGGVAARVINATSDTLVSALRELDPVLMSLINAGQDLPNALELLTTFPFPRNATSAVRGDYVNLSATLDLNLSDLLDNLLRPAAASGPDKIPRDARQGGLPTIPGTRR